MGADPRSQQKDMDDEQAEIRVTEINAQQLTDMLKSPKPPFLLDVRENWEVARGMINGASHIPMNSVPDRLGELPRDREIVVYCAAGVRSYVVAEYLLAQGFEDVMNLDGGIEAWAQWHFRRRQSPGRPPTGRAKWAQNPVGRQRTTAGR